MPLKIRDIKLQSVLGASMRSVRLTKKMIDKFMCVSVYRERNQAYIWLVSSGISHKICADRKRLQTTGNGKEPSIKRAELAPLLQKNTSKVRLLFDNAYGRYPIRLQNRP